MCNSAIRSLGSPILFEIIAVEYHSIPAYFILRLRHHLLDAIRGRFVLSTGCTSRRRAIKATSCKRSEVRKCERPAAIVSNTLGATTLVQDAGKRLNVPASSR